MSSRERRVFLLLWNDENLIDFPYQGSFEATHDLAFGFSLFGASGNVVDGGFVESHADDVMRPAFSGQLISG
jgi:hypothetical protein